MAGRRLILGVDLQNGFLTDEMRQDGYDKKVEAFLAGYASQAGDVLLTRFINKPDSPFVKIMEWQEMQQGSKTELFGNLINLNFTVVEKHGYTAWTADAKQKAAELEAGEVVIFGLDTDACVLKTALDIFEAGLRPIIAGDLCASGNGRIYHEMGLELMRLLIHKDHVVNSTKL